MKKYVFLLLVWLAQAQGQTWEGPNYIYCATDDERPWLCDEEVYRNTSLDDYWTPWPQISETDIPANGWWWNPDEPGEGVFWEISESENSSTGYFIFGVIYSYSRSGEPEWYTFGGEYQYPADATRWRERSDLFYVLFEEDQAPPDFVMGEFHGRLYRATNGACLTCGVYRPNNNNPIKNIDITWNTPYKATIRTGSRVWEVEPTNVFNGLGQPQGEFLTQGTWRVDMIAPDFLYRHKEGGGNEVDPYPALRRARISGVVRFKEVTAGVDYDPGHPFFRGMRLYPGTRCYAGGGFDSTLFDGVTSIKGDSHLYATTGYWGGDYVFLLVCWYPNNNSLRATQANLNQDGKIEPRSVGYLVTQFSGPTPAGEVQSFNLYPAARAEYMWDGNGQPLGDDWPYPPRPLIHVITNAPWSKITLSHEALNRYGMSFVRIDAGKDAAMVLPPDVSSRFDNTFEDNGYHYFRKWRKIDWNRRAKDEGGDWPYPIENGFYSPIPVNNDAPARTSAGWWWNPEQPGWGVSYQIFRRADGSDFLFGAVFTYTEDGRPTWYTFSSTVSGTETLNIEAINFRNGRPLDYNGWRQNERYQTLPLTVEWESPVKATFTINGHQWDMQRMTYYRGVNDKTADWLTTNAWMITGVRMEASRNTYYAWKHGENKWMQHPYPKVRGTVYERPQAVYSLTFTKWQKFDLNSLLMRHRNDIKRISKASDKALYYLSTRVYGERFVNYMREEEWGPDEETNPHYQTMYSYPFIWFTGPGWFDEVPLAGRYLLVYEPDTSKATMLHVGGETMRLYPNGPADDFKVLDETVLFSAYLGSPVDEEVAFEDYPCDECDTDPALKAVAAQWADRNALSMHKIRTMDDAFMKSPDWAEPCPDAEWRTQGLWPADDPRAYRLQGHVRLADPHYAAACEKYYNPAWYTPEWYQGLWYGWKDGQGPFEPHYHE